MLIYTIEIHSLKKNLKKKTKEIDKKNISDIKIKHSIILGIPFSGFVPLDGFVPYDCEYKYIIDLSIFFFLFLGSGINITTVALHSTEALMAGFLKSTDLGPHPHSYGSSHHPHHTHPHGPLPPGMPPMASLAPFGLPHGLDAVGFPQGMWGKYCFFITFNTKHL